MIVGIDHFVLTVRSVEASCAFYAAALGLERLDEPGRPTALVLGRQKINLHQTDRTFEPKAAAPTPGAGDFCLVTETPLDVVAARLAAAGVAVELGPVPRTGACGPMRSIYFRDPEGNLVEVARYEE